MEDFNNLLKNIDFYMAKAREYVNQLSKRLGHTPTCHIATFGCQMNARDSEKLMGILEQIGYVAADSENADFVLYNTCTVRENANLKVYGRLGHLGAVKRIRICSSDSADV